MDEFERLQDIIKLIGEDLGKEKPRMFKGSGAAHPYPTRSDKKPLGNIDPFDVDKKKKKKVKKKAVKISKAFIAGEERKDSGVQEVEFTLNESSHDGSQNINYYRGPSSRHQLNKTYLNKWGGRPYYLAAGFVKNKFLSVISPPAGSGTGAFGIIWSPEDPNVYYWDPDAHENGIMIAGSPNKGDLGKTSVKNPELDLEGKIFNNPGYKSVDSKDSIDGTRFLNLLKKRLEKEMAGTTMSGGGIKQITVDVPGAPAISGDAKQNSALLKVTIPKDFKGKDIVKDLIGTGVESDGEAKIWTLRFSNVSYKDTLDMTGPTDSMLATAVSKTVSEDDFAGTEIKFTFKISVMPNETSASKILATKGTDEVVTLKFTGQQEEMVVTGTQLAQDKGGGFDVDVVKGIQGITEKTNIWKSKTALVPLSQAMLPIARALQKTRFGNPWGYKTKDQGVDKFEIITYGIYERPQKSGLNIIRIVLNGVKFPNPRFRGKFGNSRAKMGVPWSVALNFINEHNVPALIKPIKFNKKFAPKDRLKEAIGDLGDTSTIEKSDEDESLIDIIIDLLPGDSDTGKAKDTGEEDTGEGDTGEIDTGTLPDTERDSEELEAEEEEEIDVDDIIFKPSVDDIEIEDDMSSRVEYISRMTGILPEAVYGIEQTESVSDPTAMAFNGQVFRKYLDNSEEQALAKSAGFKKSPALDPYYGKLAKKKFDIAYKINPVAAVKGAAWGRYQVLGETSLSLYGNDPEKFLSEFYKNPVDHSTRSFIEWINNAGGQFIDAINTGDDRVWIKMYYGPRAFKAAKGKAYLARYRAAKNNWLGSSEG